MATYIRVFVLPCVVGLCLTGPLAGQESENSFTNLRVLPANIHRDSLFTLMASFTRALGVRCSYCHVREAGQPFRTIDFSLDDREPKRKARVMLRMVQEINGQHLAGLDARRDPPIAVQCATCHRGTTEPRMLQDILLAAYRAGGLDSTVAAYASLREQYYGRFTYDFSEVVLADVAARLISQDNIADAEHLLALNVEEHPTSNFAKRQHAVLAIGRAFLTGAEHGAIAYVELKTRYGERVFTQNLLNGIGYTLLRGDHVGEAIEVFRLNVGEYPEEFNTYDSLGEAYMTNGDVALAIENYERSLALNPDNVNAVEKLRELRTGR